MSSHLHTIAGVWLALTACEPVPPLYPPTAPPEIREACALTERRCTACHERDRIVYSHNNSRAEWGATVERMRQMPGSAIAREETDVILRCLLYRVDGSIEPSHTRFTAVAGCLSTYNY